MGIEMIIATALVSMLIGIGMGRHWDYFTSEE